MENASKALIIAGAILLSILIIGLGVFIYNGAAKASDSVDMSSQEIKAYNEPYTTYGGEKVSGSKAMSLCDDVRTHNLSVRADDISKLILITNEDLSGAGKDSYSSNDLKEADANTPTSIKKDLRSGYTYKITFAYDPNTGLVTKIGIKKN